MPVELEADDRFVIGRSTVPGAGLGVFAVTALPTGATLDVIGVKVPADSHQDQCTHFADHHKFRVGDMVLIPLGFAALVNHSTTPNMERVAKPGGVALRAIREITAGEELFFQYSPAALARLGMVAGPNQ